MLAVLDWLNGSLVSVGSQDVAPAAIVGVFVLLACEIAILRDLRSAWPLAALAAAVFALLALADGRFADAGVRLILAALCVYGWVARRRGRVCAPRRAEGREIAYGVVLFGIATVVAAYALTDQNGDSFPWGSAALVAAVFVQVAALARGLLVGWWTALGGAALATALAVAAQAWASAAAAVVVGVVAAYGWRCWRRIVEPDPARVPVPADELDEDVVV
jgi:hypothetical protein